MSEPDRRGPAEVQADLALKQAELVLKNEEVEAKRAETRKTLAEAIKAEGEARLSVIELEKKEELRTLELTADRFYRTYTFTESVNDKSVDQAIATLTMWSRQDAARRAPEDKPCDMEVIFNSPGGSVISGMAFFDFLLDLRRQGHHLTTSAQGIAASMAGILLQAGDTRRMGRESWVLIHQASFGSQGSFGQVEDTVEWVKKVQERILDIFADRSKMKRATIKRNWERKDWWLSSQECLQHGFVDEVR